MPAKGWALFAGLLVFAVGVFGLLVGAAPSSMGQIASLPLLAPFSVIRMAAYLLALGFSIPYGYAAATNRRAAVVLVPLLDILQSVPSLGFFPAAVVFFVGALAAKYGAYQAEALFGTAVYWGRYCDLLKYSSRSERLRLVA